MLHPDTRLAWVDDAIGYGVFATAFIPRGTVVFVPDALDIRVTPEAYARLPAALRDQVERYCFREPDGVRVVSWDIAKYVNHCCHPNTLSCAYGCEVAIRDIEPGEQVTDDYGLLNVLEPIRVWCGRSDCRGRVQPEDVHRLVRHWDALLEPALRLAAAVPQPLAGYLDTADREALMKFAATGKGYRSVAALAMPPPGETLADAGAAEGA